MVAGTGSGARQYGRLRRVVTRPLPWVFRYLISTIPAFVLAPLVMLSLRSLFRYPIVVQALKTGSADLLLEWLNHAPTDSATPPALGLTLLLVPLAWLIVRVVWLWTEGGVLTTYVQDGRITARRFARACTSWFGPFLLLDLLGGVIVAVLIGLTAIIALVVNSVGRPL